MKKILSVLMVLCMVLALTACVTETPAPPANTGGAASPAPSASASPAPASPSGGGAAPSPATPVDPGPVEAFAGKIAIVTNDVSQSEEEFRSAEALQAKYGADKVIHRTWPANFVAEGEQMITTVQQIAADPEVKALIINQAVVGTNAAIDKLLEERDDVFIVYCSPAENPADVAARANLLLNTNDPLRGVTIIAMAKELGAEVFAHYSFPRHLGMASIAARREVMISECERLGITFIDLPAPDPTGPDGTPGTQQFILEDVPRQVAELGPNTAFFATNCAMQQPLQRMVIEHGAIYPEPCCPSPYHAFPVVLEVTDRIFDGSNMGPDADGKMVDKGRLRSVNEVVGEIRAALAAKGASGRLATWPAPASMMWTTIGFEYSVKVLNGEAPNSKDINYDLIEQLGEDYTELLTGERIGLEINTYSLTGRSWHNYVVIIMDSLIF